MSTEKSDQANVANRLHKKIESFWCKKEQCAICAHTVWLLGWHFIRPFNSSESFQSVHCQSIGMRIIYRAVWVGQPSTVYPVERCRWIEVKRWKMTWATYIVKGGLMVGKGVCVCVDVGLVASVVLVQALSLFCVC
jgi:hypothetical protein